MLAVLQIRWDMVTEAVPAFLTIAVMPLTYSIAYGKCPTLFQREQRS